MSSKRNSGSKSGRRGRDGASRPTDKGGRRGRGGAPAQDNPAAHKSGAHKRLRASPAPSYDEQKPGRLWIYGRHAAMAALANPDRKVKRILASRNAREWLDELRRHPERLLSLTEVEPGAIDRALHDGAVHQGIAVEVEDLPRARLREACEPTGAQRPVVVLDQITDPHNIGAIFRSAAAFGARAVIVQDRRTPPLAGALAKAAAGALEVVPCVPVVNIARALDGLKALGYFCAGLAGESGPPISALPTDRPIALVLGAEGAGLRHLVRETCDGLYAIPIARGVDSLNVSNAAAVSLYEIARDRDFER